MHISNVVILSLIALCPFMFGSCGSTSELGDLPPAAPPAAPPAQESPVRREFETRTDTVTTEKATIPSAAPAAAREPVIRYTVQIGAFKNAQNASQVQTVARERYHLPVINDYDINQAMYQIRIGFFESQEVAQAFGERLRREFPADYRDSWVVQLKR
jgi:cell division septation protein DedD